MKHISLSKFLGLTALSSCLLITSISSEGFTFSSQNNQPNSQLWNSMTSSFQLNDNEQNAAVNQQIHVLQQDPKALYSMLKNAAPYINYIYKQTQNRGLPAELALLPVVESSFNPYACSKVGACGLWQLMPKTASTLGIKTTSNYDGRRDVVASTSAALTYLNSLHGMFHNDWFFALAAYNWGSGNIKHAENHDAGVTYWNMNMPQETRLYVPKLLALAAVIKDPQKYHIALPPISQASYLNTVQVGSDVNLAQAAKTAGVSVQTIQYLNPAYKQVNTVDNGSHTLLIPVSSSYQPDQTTSVTA